LHSHVISVNMMRLPMLSLGCAVALSAAPAVTQPTFNRDVLPVLQKNCQVCHRPGEAAPFSLLTYESARPWAKAIKAAVLSRKMPPWFADPKYGHFVNDPRLEDADIQTIVAWVDAGAPGGEAKDKPAPVEWREGWNIKPDVVVSLLKPYTVPRKAVVPWLDFVVHALPHRTHEENRPLVASAPRTDPQQLPGTEADF
jgi:hypothetical protein